MIYLPRIILQDVNEADFRLPVLGPKLRAFCKDLNEGKGFQLIRGIPVTRYSTEQNVIAFWCIGLHFGSARPQNRRQHLLGHVKVKQYQQPSRKPMKLIYRVLPCLQDNGFSSSSKYDCSTNPAFEKGRRSFLIAPL